MEDGKLSVPQSRFCLPDFRLLLPFTNVCQRWLMRIGAADDGGAVATAVWRLTFGCEGGGEEEYTISP